MKKNTLPLTALFFMMGGYVMFGQTVTASQKAVNDSLVKVLTARNLSAKEKAIQTAKEKGWPLKIVTENSYSELIRLSEEGTPIYYKTSNAGSARTSRANKLYEGGGLGLALSGAGIQAGIWDGNHARTDHLTFGGRAIIADSFTETAVHPTHVAGTMVGSGANGATTFNANAKGIAFAGSLTVHDWTNDTAEMTGEASELLVSNHSYGLDAEQSFPLYYFGAYLQDSRDIDQMTFNNPYYQPVIAAGNDRDSNVNPTKFGNDLLTTMSTAKNAVVVAAVGQVNSYTTPTAVNIASFSNFGPTDDFRIKPDIATKGVNVTSSTNTSTTSYGVLSGTSMAAPGISGCIMLLQEHYRNLNGAATAMKSATVRGLIAHTADEIGSEDGPDHMTGWGLMNAEKAALLISKKGTQNAVFTENTLSQSQTYTIQVVASGTEPLVATLSWTDRQGQLSNSTVDATTSRLVNNLDLRVISSTNQENFPWMLNQNWDEIYALKGDNNADNIEKVEIPVAAGTYTIRVTHKGNLTGGAQDYSLLVSGINQVLGTAAPTKDFAAIWPNPAKNTLNVKLDGSGDASVTLYDISGRIVLAEKMNGAQSTFGIESLPQGVYLAEIKQGERQITKKIVKN